MCHLIEFNSIFLIGEGRRIIDTTGKKFSEYFDVISYQIWRKIHDHLGIDTIFVVNF